MARGVARCGNGDVVGRGDGSGVAVDGALLEGLSKVVLGKAGLSVTGLVGEGHRGDRRGG